MDRTLQIGNYEVHLFLNDIDTQNIVFEIAFENHGAEVLAQCHDMGVQAFHYAVITGFDWEHDLSPWAASNLVSKNDIFGGQADTFLQVLVNDMVPQVVGAIQDASSPIADNVNYNCSLIGYSLAGLTALYSAYRYNTFDAVGSISGALWYPDFLTFVQEHDLSPAVKAVYLSLGDKEHKTRNPHMSQVQACTEAIHALLEKQGVQTAFELNPGNHFKDEVLRIAKCLKWLFSLSV